MDRPPVELDWAYLWTCAACGQRQYVDAVVIEFSAEDRERLAKKYRKDQASWQTGRWFTSPDDVTCEQCGQVFDTVGP